MKRHLSLASLCLASLVAGCGAPEITSDSPANLTPFPPINFYIYGWNAAWDRFDPGAIEDMPAVASDGTTWEMVYIALGGHVINRSSTDGVHFGAPVDLGGGFFGKPAAALVHGSLLVAAPNGLGVVSTKFRTNGTWDSAWKQQPGKLLNPGVTIALTDSGWRYHLFGVGPDQSLYELSGIGGFWDANWVSRGGKLLPTTPAAVSWGGNRIDVVAAAPGNTPWHEWQDNEVLGGWESLGGAMEGQPAISSRAPNMLDVFVIGTDNALYQKVYDGGWKDYTQVVDCAQHLGVTVASPTLGTTGRQSIDVYVLGYDHGAVWHNRYSTTPSATAGPLPYCCGLPGRNCCTGDDAPDACQGQGQAATYCNPADNKCEQCGSAVGQACCTNVDSDGARPLCGYGPSTTVCNIYSNRCDSSGGPAGAAYQVCRAGGVCDAGNTCTGRNVDRDIAGYCKPNPTPSCGAAKSACSSSANCCSGLECVGGACTASSGTAPGAKTCGGNPVNSSTQNYNVGVRYSTGCAELEAYAYANSQAEAVACVQKAYPNQTLFPGQYFTTYQFAEYSPIDYSCQPRYVAAFSSADAAACAHSLCVTCTDVLGTCQ
jgi:hypothetical protein